MIKITTNNIIYYLTTLAGGGKYSHKIYSGDDKYLFFFFFERGVFQDHVVLWTKCLRTFCMCIYTCAYYNYKVYILRALFYQSTTHY